MQARPPPINVNLQIANQLVSTLLPAIPARAHVLVRVYTGYVCRGDAVREGLQPPFRVPHVCIEAPDIWIPVDCIDVDLYGSAIRNEELAKYITRGRFERGVQGENVILARSVDPGQVMSRNLYGENSMARDVRALDHRNGREQPKRFATHGLKEGERVQRVVVELAARAARLS